MGLVLVPFKCRDCGHLQSVSAVIERSGTYFGSSSNWCDLCGGRPYQVETPFSARRANYHSEPSVVPQIVATGGLISQALTIAAMGLELFVVGPADFVEASGCLDATESIPAGHCGGRGMWLSRSA